MSRGTDFIILIDGLRHDYIDGRNTPFLAGLRGQGVHADVIETFAFQTRPAYFAGLDPDESNICHLFQFDPEESPFRFLRPWRAVTRALDAFALDRFCRGVVRRVAKRIEIGHGYRASADVISTEQVPLSLLHYFSLSERAYTDAPDVFPGRKTIFDRMREAGISWHWIGYPRNFGSTESILGAFRAATAADVVYLHFSELDWIGHRHGPASPQMRQALGEMDSTLRSVLEGPLTDGASAVVFGDHGMVEVEFEIDLRATLAKLPVTLGKDFLYFLDSTQARLWFFDDRAREVILEALAGIEAGHVVTDAERRTLGIEFQDPRYGDEIFVLDGPGILHPSFFSKGSQGPRGMHGYLPAIRDNTTQVLAVGPGIRQGDLGTIPMTQIYQIINDVIVERRAGQTPA